MSTQKKDHDKELDEVTGEELYSRFIAGDEQALEELIGKYRRGLTLFINGFVHDMDNAEELMIDVFAELIAGRSKFKGRSSFKTYLFAIGRNLAMRYLRKNGKTNTSFFHGGGGSGSDLSDDAGKHGKPVGAGAGGDLSPEEVYLKEEEARNIYNNMMALKEEYSQALYLIYFEDMSYAEAAKVMKKSENQIAGLVHRAKAALKLSLEKEGITYP